MGLGFRATVEFFQNIVQFQESIGQEDSGLAPFELHYHALEKNPELIAEHKDINDTFANLKGVRLYLHQGSAEEQISLLLEELNNKVHIIYQDPFSPVKNPELWTKSWFSLLHPLLHPQGIMSTYCSSGQARRNMVAAGFEVLKQKGFAFKRECLVAFKEGKEKESYFNEQQRAESVSKEIKTSTAS